MRSGDSRGARVMPCTSGDAVVAMEGLARAVYAAGVSTLRFSRMQCLSCADVWFTSEEISDSFGRRTMYHVRAPIVPTDGSAYIPYFTTLDYPVSYLSLGAVTKENTRRYVSYFGCLLFLPSAHVGPRFHQHCEWFSSLFCCVETSIEAHGNISINKQSSKY
jgi:hypothetical protein